MATIIDALNRIYKYGTPTQKLIVSNLKSSSIQLVIQSIGGASGDCGVVNSSVTQKKINSQMMNEIQSLGELRIRIDPITATTSAGLEGTLVHEARHAYHMARAISEFSQAHKMKLPKTPYNPDGFEIEYAAHNTYIDYVRQAIRLKHPDRKVFENEAVNIVKIADSKNGTITANIGKIYARLATSSYNYNGTTMRGQKFGSHWGLTPRTI
jgi:hypothetical protein